MDATIRRLQNNLFTLGTGTIAFGIWTVIKYFLLCTVDIPNIIYSTGQIPDDIYRIAFFIIVMTVAIFDFILRCVIGFSARSEGRGKKKGWFYLITAIITILLYVFGVITEITAMFSATEGLLNKIITLLIDTTSIVLIIEIIISSIKLKKLLRVRGGAHE